VPWYVDPLVYSQARAPGLASHILRAQGSGLPGGPFSTPLTRASTAVRGQNRRLACGDAPSVIGLSCDEYPFASSQQGLTAGGTRRTFGDCTFNLPRATGPTGVSVCMIRKPSKTIKAARTGHFTSVGASCREIPSSSLSGHERSQTGAAGAAGLRQIGASPSTRGGVD
jgi:plasmid stability protein